MELVQCTTSDGVRLDGLWNAATGAPSTPVDAVITLHGVTGNFYSTDFFNAAADELTQRGIAVIRANNRGHDVVNRSMGESGVTFIGSSFEKIEDANKDCAAWISYAAQRGARRIVLWGHSLGAVKAVLYAASARDARLAGVIASSPPRFSYEAFRTDPVEWPTFERHYQEALALVERGAGDALMRVEKPTNLIIAARTFLEKYGPQGGFDYVDAARDITTPLLLTMGGKEGVEARPGFSRIALYGSDDYLRELANGNAAVRYVNVPGADHWYVGCEAALTGTVTSFLSSLS